MGYRTYYDLSANVLEEAFVEMVRELREMSEDAAYALDIDGSSLQDMLSWYNDNDDMRALSLTYPDVVFTLHGEGEGSGDIWRKYYRNGKMQVDCAQIVFHGFDELKLT